MKFSVLMSLYIKENAQHLDECLASLAAQTLAADEIVIVLDGPITDELEHTLNAWQSKLPIKKHPLPENVGLGRALNHGLQHCTHDWVFRMDTDDICVPTRFEQQVNFIRENPDTVLLGGQIKEFSSSPTETGNTRTVPTEPGQIYCFAKKKNPFNHMTIAFNKDNIIAHGGYQHHLFMEDYNLWLRVIAKDKHVHNLDKVLVLVRAGDAMLARRKGLNYVRSEWQLYKLKNKLGFHNTVFGILLFLARAIPRLLPSKLLSIVYKWHRSSE